MLRITVIADTTNHTPRQASLRVLRLLRPARRRCTRRVQYLNARGPHAIVNTTVIRILCVAALRFFAMVQAVIPFAARPTRTATLTCTLITHLLVSTIVRIQIYLTGMIYTRGTAVQMGGVSRRTTCGSLSRRRRHHRRRRLETVLRLQHLVRLCHRLPLFGQQLYVGRDRGFRHRTHNAVPGGYSCRQNSDCQSGSCADWWFSAHRRFCYAAVGNASPCNVAATVANVPGYCFTDYGETVTCGSQTTCTNNVCV